MLSIVKDINHWELRDELWSRALETLDAIIQADKLHDLMTFLEEFYPGSVSITTINDLLWFEELFLFEQLGVEEHVQKRL